MKPSLAAILVVLLVGAAVAVLWSARSRSYRATPVPTDVFARKVLHGEGPDRSAAAAELSRRNDETARATFRRILKEDADPAWRSRAAQALGRLRAEEAFPDLAAALADPSDRVHSSACWAIGRLGDPRGIEILRPHVLDPKNNQRTRDALWALREIKCPESERLLIERLPPAYPPSQVTILAVTALGQSGGERALTALRTLRKTLPKEPEIPGEAPRRPARSGTNSRWPWTSPSRTSARG